MPHCSHRRRRQIAPTVVWCPECGSHSRVLGSERAARWSRWIPCGVQRLPPSSRAVDFDFRQLSLQLHLASYVKDLAAASLELERELSEETEEPN